MSGTMIDLMPDAIRRKAMAGQRLRRLIAIGVVTMGLLVAFATHLNFAMTGFRRHSSSRSRGPAQALQLNAVQRK